MRSASGRLPDQVRSLGHGSGGYVEVAGLAIGRATLEPGWRWSRDVKPLVGTTSCLIHHFQLLLEGRFHVRMDDGDEHEFGPGEVIDIPPGHDVWVVGDSPAVLVDMAGNSAEFALPVAPTRAVLTILNDGHRRLHEDGG